MSGPVPTAGQMKVSHAIVGVAGGLAVQGATSEVRMTQFSRVVLFLLSGAVVAFLHQEADAPVAHLIAKLVWR